MIRLLISSILFFLFDWYAFQPLAEIAAEWSPIAKTIAFTAYWSIPLLALGLMMGIGQERGAHKRPFGRFSSVLGVAYLSKFFMIIILLIDDLRMLFLQVFDANMYEYGRSLLASQIALAGGLIPFVVLTYGIIRNPYRYKIFKETIKIDGLPNRLNGLKIVQISDIHSGSFDQKEPVEKAIEMINNQKADLVFFTGDLVNSMANEMDQFIDVFDKISAKYGVYSILGNHDYGDYMRWKDLESKEQNFQKMIETHRLMGWDLMRNENRMVKINGENIAVIGVENYSAHPRFPKYGDMDKAINGTEEASLKLLLSHDPSHWEDEIIKRFKDIAITFSGHTHGFQFGFEIPGWIKWSPSKYIYKQWAGLYQTGKQFLYVNRGFGFLGYHGRVGILPEITVIELKSSN